MKNESGSTLPDTPPTADPMEAGRRAEFMSAAGAVYGVRVVGEALFREQEEISTETYAALVRESASQTQRAAESQPDRKTKRRRRLSRKMSMEDRKTVEERLAKALRSPPFRSECMAVWDDILTGGRPEPIRLERALRAWAVFGEPLPSHVLEFLANAVVGRRQLSTTAQGFHALYEGAIEIAAKAEVREEILHWAHVFRTDFPLGRGKRKRARRESAARRDEFKAMLKERKLTALTSPQEAALAIVSWQRGLSVETLRRKYLRHPAFKKW